MTLDLPPWIRLVLVLAGAPGLAMLALALVHGLLDRLPRLERAPVLRRVLRDGRLPLRIAVGLFAALAALPAADLPESTAASLVRILGLALAAATGWTLTRKAAAIFDAFIDRSRDAGEDDLLLRRRRTQLVVFRRLAISAGVVLTIGLVLTAIPAVRAIGLSLFASAGVAGIVAGIAARPAVSNLIAGVQIALTQPIRIGDAVMVENAWGHVEEIGSTFVSVSTWDQRSLIVPLTYFLEKPISNWTRNSSRLLDTVFVHLDYGVSVEGLRAKAREILEATPLWDRRVFAVQVTELRERGMEIRVLMSAANAGRMFDLRCLLREQLVAWLVREHPDSLIRDRVELRGADPRRDAALPAAA